MEYVGEVGVVAEFVKEVGGVSVVFVFAVVEFEFDYFLRRQSSQVLICSSVVFVLRQFSPPNVALITAEVSQALTLVEVLLLGRLSCR